MLARRRPQLACSARNGSGETGKGLSTDPRCSGASTPSEGIAVILGHSVALLISKCPNVYAHARSLARGSTRTCGAREKLRYRLLGPS
eukprot:510503-Pyramimonas_sp.AAC.2